jgi:predicted  nucleic acid-binding Zn-ribbon protein
VAKDDDLVWWVRDAANSICGQTGAKTHQDKLHKAADEIEKMRSHIKLHAGDTLSLDNEVNLMRDHWQEAEARIRELEAELSALRN